MSLLLVTLQIVSTLHSPRRGHSHPINLPPAAARHQHTCRGQTAARLTVAAFLWCLWSRYGDGMNDDDAQLTAPCAGAALLGVAGGGGAGAGGGAQGPGPGRGRGCRGRGRGGGHRGRRGGGVELRRLP